MNKNEFIAKIQPGITEVWNDFQEHYITYTSLTLAGIVTGMRFARRIRDHQQNSEVVHRFEELLVEKAEHRDAA